MVLLAGISVGCDAKTDDVVSPRSGINVQLPSKPELRKPRYKRTHGDGVLTVEGLLRDRDAHLNREVTVRGKVDRLHLCERTAQETIPAQPRGGSSRRLNRAEKGTGGVELAVGSDQTVWKCRQQPYAMLVDTRGNERFRLRVGGSMRSRLASLKEGELVDLTGEFDVVSSNRKYMDQRGVLYLRDSDTSPEKNKAAAP